MAGVRSRAASKSSRAIRIGRICFSSTNTLTATTVQVSAQATRPVGPGWSPNSSSNPVNEAPPIVCVLLQHKSRLFPFDEVELRPVLQRFLAHPEYGRIFLSLADARSDTSP